MRMSARRARIEEHDLLLSACAKTSQRVVVKIWVVVVVLAQTRAALAILHRLANLGPTSSACAREVQRHTQLHQHTRRRRRQKDTAHSGCARRVDLARALGGRHVASKAASAPPAAEATHNPSCREPPSRKITPACVRLTGDQRLRVCLGEVRETAFARPTQCAVGDASCTVGDASYQNPVVSKTVLSYFSFFY